MFEKQRETVTRILAAGAKVSISSVSIDGLAIAESARNCWIGVMSRSVFYKRQEDL